MMIWKKCIAAAVAAAALLSATPVFAMAAEEPTFIPYYAYPYMQNDEDTEAEAVAEEEEITEPEEPVIPPDAEGTLSFENLETRVRTGNPSILALEESIASIDAVDYEQMRKTLLDQINAVASASRFMSSLGINVDLTSASKSLLDVWDDLKEGKIQKDYEDAKRQLEYVLDLTVQGAQMLYITTVTLEQNLEDGERGLAALDRTIEEMQLRYELGQIPEMTLLQLQDTRASTASQLETLRTNIATCKAQLQVMIGETPTGELTLMPLPEVVQEQVDAMNLEEDLEQAKSVSWTLYDAADTLDDAREDYLEGMRENSTPATAYVREQIEHTYQAAQYTYQATVQSFELSFGSEYRAVKNDWQVLQANISSYAYQQKNYAVAETKYAQGTISRNDLLTEKDNLMAAASAVVTARNNLFKDYNAYQWAVVRGIVSQ